MSFHLYTHVLLDKLHRCNKELMNKDSYYVRKLMSRRSSLARISLIAIMYKSILYAKLTILIVNLAVKHLAVFLHHSSNCTSPPQTAQKAQDALRVPWAFRNFVTLQVVPLPEELQYFNMTYGTNDQDQGFLGYSGLA